ncbi:hypothetical protein ACHAXT_009950 [Thalassiosira profunda]
MSKLNTAEYDHKGRCVRHPAIRLRKKKLFGGWKVVIGHCPECCLDEMRRVRDEIGAERDDDSRGGEYGDRRERRRRKHKKKHKRRHRERERRAGDSISEHPSLGSDGQPRPVSLESTEATGSTAPNSSMDGNGSVMSGQYHQNYGGGGRDAYYPPPPRQHASSPPAAQRTMVLSMAFTDPTMGQRGTYTGQVNSINHKPDGKGTVYYANGSIAEGTWSNGLLLEGEDEAGGGGYEPHGRNYPPPPPPPGGSRSRSNSRSRARAGDPSGRRGPRSSRSSSRGGEPRPFKGNLDRLDQLGGAQRGPRGASASVQSYGSRGSRGGYDGPRGSASVQDFGGRQSFDHVRGGGSGGGGASVMGFEGQYQRPLQRSGSGYHKGNRGGNPSGYR